jgi:hypothetical protein
LWWTSLPARCALVATSACLFVSSIVLKLNAQRRRYWYRRTSPGRESLISVFQNGSNKYSGVICGFEEKFRRSGGLRVFPGATSGEHPMRRFR